MLTLKPETPEKFPAISADVYEAQIVYIAQEIQKANAEFKIAGGKEVIKLGFAIVEDGPNYGRHFFKGNISYKLSKEGTYKASTLWVICCAINGKDLTPEEKTQLLEASFLESFLTNARLRIVLKQKQGDDGAYNVVADFMPRKAPGLSYDKAKSDAQHGMASQAYEPLPDDWLADVNVEKRKMEAATTPKPVAALQGTLADGEDLPI